MVYNFSFKALGQAELEGLLDEMQSRFYSLAQSGSHRAGAGSNE